jgi:hypothetical protein
VATSVALLAGRLKSSLPNLDLLSLNQSDKLSARTQVGAREEFTEMRFKIVLEPSDEGGFTIYVPALPGCISEGETEEEALRSGAPTR